MALIQIRASGTSTGVLQTTTIYTVPAGRTLYIRFCYMGSNAALVAGNVLNILRSSDSMSFHAVFGANANSYFQEFLGERGFPIAPGDVVQFGNIAANTTPWVAEIMGDLV